MDPQFSYTVLLDPVDPQYSSFTYQIINVGVFWKIQEICNKMGTRICKIVEEMAEIIKPKVGNPKNSVSRN